MRFYGLMVILLTSMVTLHGTYGSMPTESAPNKVRSSKQGLVYMGKTTVGAFLVGTLVPAETIEERLYYGACAGLIGMLAGAYRMTFFKEKTESSPLIV